MKIQTQIYHSATLYVVVMANYYSAAVHSYTAVLWPT